MLSMSHSLRILTAEPDSRTWSRELVTSLSDWPIEWHLTHTEQHARELAASADVQLCVLDQSLPGVGGLELLRSFRRLGFRFPCVLVCDDAVPSLLKEALSLEVYSVVEAARQRELLVPTVVRMVRNSFPSNGYADAAFN
jgi:DNA-binding NtrC family response regulator